VQLNEHLDAVLVRPLAGPGALARLRSPTCILDGEAVACGEDGIALFERIRYRRHDGSVFMWAFDIIELDGDDLRREPLERRKASLERLLGRAGSAVCSSTSTWTRYQSGRSRAWVKAKNPDAPAVTRLGNEDWGRSWSARGLRGRDDGPLGKT
jgi:ATP-dependent DNA ligase